MPEEKPKRQMTPEARSRMLSNLAKGRAANGRWSSNGTMRG